MDTQRGRGSQSRVDTEVKEPVPSNGPESMGHGAGVVVLSGVWQRTHTLFSSLIHVRRADGVAPGPTHSYAVLTRAASEFTPF